MSLNGLTEAYLRTEYAFVWKGKWVSMSIGRKSQGLASCLRAESASSAAVITAFNPRSVSKLPTENDARHADLIASIQAVGGKYFDAEGRDPSAQWPPERSVLLLDASFARAADLADRFEQNAFVFAGPDAVPRLVFGQIAAETITKPGPGSKRRPSH